MLMTSCFSRLSVIALLLVGFAGCSGPSGPPQDPRFSVTGTVTLDGQPLPDGFIAFESAEDVAAGRSPASAEIINGQYQLDATPGTKQVKIFREEKTGEVDATGMEITRQTIPARYNTRTQLEAQVADPGPTEVNFDLKSK